MKRALAALALAAALFPALAAAAPREMTIEAVLEDRARLEGKVVRLRGVVDQCTRFYCHICPSASAKDAECLKLYDWKGQFDEDGPYHEWRQEQLELNAANRFTELVVEAKVDFFSPADQRAFEEERAAAAEFIDYFPCTPDEKRMCLPKDGVRLMEIRVLRRVRRPGALDGPVTAFDSNPVRPAPTEVLEALRAAYETAGGTPIAGRPSAAGLSHEGDSVGWLCIATGLRPPRHWPTNWGQLEGTDRDGYRCYTASHFSGKWVVNLEEEDG